MNTPITMHLYVRVQAHLLFQARVRARKSKSVQLTASDARSWKLGLQSVNSGLMAFYSRDHFPRSRGREPKRGRETLQACGGGGSSLAADKLAPVNDKLPSIQPRGTFCARGVIKPTARLAISSCLHLLLLLLHRDNRVIYARVCAGRKRGYNNNDKTKKKSESGTRGDFTHSCNYPEAHPRAVR